MKETNNWNNLYEIQIFKNSYFRNKIEKSTSKLSILTTIWIIFGIVPLLTFYITSKIDNSIFLVGERGLIQDIIFLSYYIFIPSLISLAVLYFPNLSTVLHSFREIIIKDKLDVTNNSHKNIFPMTVEKFNSMLKHRENLIAGRGKYKYYKLLFIIGGMLWVVIGAKAHWFAFDTYGMDIWSSQNYVISFIIRTIYEFFVFGIIFPLMLYKFFTILYSIKIFSKELTIMNVLRLRPLNPDKAGGLGILGKYSLKMVLFLIPPLIPIFAYILFGNVTILLIIGVTLYTPLLVFAFFYPLSGAHDVMKKTKDQELRMLSSEFNKIYDSFIADIKNDKLKDLPTDFKILEKLDNLYNKAEDMPVWPFDTKTLAKFGSILGALISSIWLNWLFGQMVQM